MRLPKAVAWPLAVLLAGCIGADDGPPSQWEEVEAPGPVLHTLASVEPFSAASADGTVLAGHVYLPDREGPLAAVLEYSPYWNTQNGRSDTMAVPAGDGRTTLQLWLGPYLDAGFAVALVDARGFGLSGGCEDFGGELESQDIRAVVDALAAKPWSNGNVGMVGLSYPAWMQYAALRDPSPHLKTIIPVSGVIDYHSLTQRNGAAYNVGPALSGIITALSVAGVAVNAAQEGEPGETSPEHAACPSIAEGVANDAGRLRGDRNAYWDERDYRGSIAPFGRPILATNGMTDGEGHILQFDGLWERLPPGSRLLVGQWGHGYPGGYPDTDPDYAGPDYPSLAVAWMDHHLRGGPPVPTGFVEYEDDAGGWHTAPSWPPPSTAVTLHLSGDALSTDEGAAAGTQTFLSAPNDPVPAACPTQALYVSPPLAEDVLLAGYFTANLTLASTLPDGDLVVTLWHGDVGAECQAGAAQEVRRAITDLRHRGHLAVGVDFPVTGTDGVDVRSYPHASVAKAGERLLLTVAGGSTELFPEAMRPAITVHGGSSITVSVASGTLRFA